MVYVLPHRPEDGRGRSSLMDANLERDENDRSGHLAVAMCKMPSSHFSSSDEEDARVSCAQISGLHDSHVILMSVQLLCASGARHGRTSSLYDPLRASFSSSKKSTQGLQASHAS